MKLNERAPALLTTRQAAAMLGLHSTTVTRMCERGDLPAVRIGERGRWRLIAANVKRLVREQPVPGREPRASSPREDS
jgi:excisionase family DNA binding protein